MKSHLYAAVDEEIEVLVVLAGPVWVQETIGALIQDVKNRYPEATIRLVTTSDERGATFISEQAIDFELIASEDDEVEGAVLGKALGSRKALCVRPSNQPEFSSVLLRWGFPQNSVPLLFEERVFPPDQNSNLSSKLSRGSDSYGALLYAYEGLRHLSKGAKKVWGTRLVNRRTTTDVVRHFKATLLSY